MTVVGRLDMMRATSASPSRNAAGAQRSNCCEYLRTASSPFDRMSASTAATVSTTCGLLVLDVPASAAGALSVLGTVCISLRCWASHAAVVYLRTCLQSQCPAIATADTSCAATRGSRAHSCRGAAGIHRARGGRGTGGERAGGDRAQWYDERGIQ